MNTPRKRVLPIQGSSSSLTSAPVQEAPPRWAALFHTWAREGGLRSLIGMFPPHHAPVLNTPAGRALPVMVPLMSRLDTRLQALHHEVMEAGGEASEATATAAEQLANRVTRGMSGMAGHLVRIYGI
ncbi:hypothetical protein L1887_28632 [Cichorium endivia]|nr:hypothetical protein L1887_28632 [Cichorium endivia]